MTLLLLALHAQAQIAQSEYAGTYGDWMYNGEALTTELDLKPDGTFKLRTVDPVYPQTHKEVTNTGVWAVKDEEVVLNPNLEKRQPTVTMTEKTIGLQDSIEIKVNHHIKVYENQELVEHKQTEFELLTLYFNKKRKYTHLVRTKRGSGPCMWAPKVKNQVIVDSTSTFRIAKQDLEKIGVYTYGFTKDIELIPKDPNSDYFEIDVLVPMDQERMPRSKQVIIKGERAYFYERNGKVDKWLTPLQKKGD